MKWLALRQIPLHVMKERLIQRKKLFFEENHI